MTAPKRGASPRPCSRTESPVRGAGVASPTRRSPSASSDGGRGPGVAPLIRPAGHPHAGAGAPDPSTARRPGGGRRTPRRAPGGPAPRLDRAQGGDRGDAPDRGVPDARRPQRPARPAAGRPDGARGRRGDERWRGAPGDSRPACQPPAAKREQPDQGPDERPAAAGRSGGAAQRPGRGQSAGSDRRRQDVRFPLRIPEGAPIASPALRQVEHAVRLAVELGRIGAPLGKRHAAVGESDRVRLRRPGKVETHPVDPLQQPLADLLGRRRLRVGQDQGEFLAADPTDQIDAAQPAEQFARHGAQHPVPDGMAPGVVDPLEVVDVGQDQRQRRFPPARPFDFEPELPVEIGPVVHAGQAVGVNQPAHLEVLAPTGGDKTADQARVAQQARAGRGVRRRHQQQARLFRPLASSPGRGKQRHGGGAGEIVLPGSGQRAAQRGRQVGNGREPDGAADRAMSGPERGAGAARERRHAPRDQTGIDVPGEQHGEPSLRQGAGQQAENPLQNRLPVRVARLPHGERLRLLHGQQELRQPVGGGRVGERRRGHCCRRRRRQPGGDGRKRLTWATGRSAERTERSSRWVLPRNTNRAPGSREPSIATWIRSPRRTSSPATARATRCWRAESPLATACRAARRSTGPTESRGSSRVSSFRASGPWDNAGHSRVEAQAVFP